MKIISLFLFMTVSSYFTFASDIYWINGSGNWSDSTHWSLASGGASCNCIPDSTTNAVFDNNSFITGDTLTIDAIAYCNNLLFNGIPVTVNGISDLNIYGSLTLSAGMSMPFSGKMFFLSTNSGNSISTSGVDVNSQLIFNGSGEWMLIDSLVTAQAISLTAGSLLTNNNYVNALKLISQSSQTRSLQLGSALVELNGDLGNTTIAFWNNNFSFDAGTSIIRITGPRGGVLASPGMIFYDVEFTNAADNVTHSFQGGGGTDTLYFHDLRLSNSTNIFPTINVSELELAGGRFYQFSKVILKNLIHSANCYNPIEIWNSSFFKDSGIVSLSYARLSKVEGLGGALYVADYSKEISPCPGWIINEPVSQTYYWVNGKGQWNDTAHWSLSSGGQPAGCLPGCNDDVVFDSNSFLQSGDSVLMDQLHLSLAGNCCRNMLWQPVPFNPVLKAGLTLYGSLALHPTMSTAENNSSMPLVGFGFASDSIQNTVTTAGKRLSGLFFRGDGEWTLMDSVDCSNITHGGGHLNTNSQYIRLDNFESWDNDSTDTLTLGASIIDITANYSSPYSGFFKVTYPELIVNEGTSLIRFSGANNRLFNIGHQLYDVQFINSNTLGTIDNTWGDHRAEYNSVEFLGNGQIVGEHQMNDLHLSPGKSYFFYTNDTTIITGSLQATGNAGDTIRFNSSGNAYISHSGDTICLDYISVQNVHAIGASAFFAGANSINLGNSTGWIFQSCETVSISEFNGEDCCNLHPTLAQDQFTVYVKENNADELYLLDVAGHLVKKQVIQSETTPVDVSSLNNGLYLLMLTEMGRVVYSGKIVKY